MSRSLRSGGVLSNLRSRTVVRALIVLLVGGLAWMGDPASTLGDRESVAPEGAAVRPGRVLVRVAPQVDVRELMTGLRGGVRSVRPAFAEAARPELASSLGLDRWHLLEIDPATDPEREARSWATVPGVEAACADYESELDGTPPSDPMFALQWGHDNTAQMLDYCDGCGGHDGGVPVGAVGFDSRIDEAWDLAGYGDSSVVVAFVDTGVDLDHPDLVLGPGYDFFANDPDPEDTNGHGTMVAGIIAATVDNGIGTAGVAPGCTLMPIRAGGSTSERATAIQWAADNGADVINMSWTFYNVFDHPAFEAALDYAAAAGVVLVSSSGNRNQSVLWLPQSHIDVISVGAASPCGDRKRSSSDPGEVNSGYNTDPNGVTCDNEKWWGSSYGVDVQDANNAMDLLSPIILPTTRFDGDYESWFGGTSCSAPFVSGVAALLLSAHPGWTPLEVRTAMTTTAIDVVNVESAPGWDRYAGYGLVDAAAAIGWVSSVSAPEGALRLGARLERVGPSPFRESTRIDWASDRAADVSLAVYDTAGRRVRQLAAGPASAGVHSAVWDGRDEGGRLAAAGIYFVRLEGPDGPDARKIVRTR